MIIIAASKSKSVMAAEELDAARIQRFVSAYERNEQKKHGLTDPVTSDSEL